MQQNHRIVGADQHRKALVKTGTELVSFNLLKPENINAIQDLDYSDDYDLKNVMRALDKIQLSLMEYAKYKKDGKYVLQKAGQNGPTVEPRFVKDALAEMD